MNPADRDTLLAAFALGLNRQPLPALPGFGAVPPLAALALAGQSLRLALPLPPAEPAQAWCLPDDTVPPLPDTVRGTLLRLVTRIQGRVADGLAQPLRAHVAASGHRLHPFDFPRLGWLLAAAGSRPAEQAWLGRNASPALTTDTWRDAAPWQRARFLTALREHDPGHARSLLEAAFATDTAKVRAQLLLALGTGLSLADRPFLTAAAADGAAPVQQAAEGLLALLPGSAAMAARVATAAASFRVGRTVAYQPTGPAPSPLQTLEGIGLADLAAALGTDAGALARMDAEDPVRLALAACALRDGAVDLAAAAMDRMQQVVWPGDLAALGPAFARLPGRHAFAARVLRPTDPAGLGGDWREFCIQLGSPLGVATATAILASPGWRNFLAKLTGSANADNALLPAAVLMPPALAAPFAATLPPGHHPLTTVLLAFLAELAALTDGTPPP